MIAEAWDEVDFLGLRLLLGAAWNCPAALVACCFARREHVQERSDDGGVELPARATGAARRAPPPGSIAGR